MQQCDIKLGNITDITADIVKDTAAWMAADDDLRARDQLIFQALATLGDQTHEEAQNRSDKDMLLMNQVADIQENLIRTINGQFPINGLMLLEAVNPPRVTVTNGTSGPNVIEIGAEGVLSINGVRSNADGRLNLVAGPGVAIDQPGPHTLRVNTSDMGTFRPRNYAKLTHVYPYGAELASVQSYFGTVLGFHTVTAYPPGELSNGPRNCAVVDHLVGNLCASNAECGNLTYTRCDTNGRCVCDSCVPGVFDMRCQNTLGTGYTCVSTGGGGRCAMTSPVCNPTNCAGLLGPKWRCNSLNFCIFDYCDYRGECLLNTNLAPAGDGFRDALCINHRCTQSVPSSSGTQLPTPLVPLFYKVISQAGILATNEPGFNGQNSVVIGNRPAPNAQVPYLPFPLWEGQRGGFVVPNENGTWIVTVSIEVDFLLVTLLQIPSMWVQMHIDRGAGWEVMDSQHLSRRLVTTNTGGSNPFDTGVTARTIMSTTLLVSTSAYAKGQPIYAGWSAYYSNKNPGQTAGNACWWYRISYEITRFV